MPSNTTPAKHKTPNYRLVTRTYGTKPHTYSVSRWEATPLRADRKDLRPAA